ncbi:hypothetical protein FSP39_020063 [Pinctada imbricata]|uniref:Uncharacterized protein n=1 Tax=Pinctada imbricata TaxID=66713 RepID=A0AA88Y5X1_PINIB|nr:hypothetical protein FSP39_020063 [Pinctada imbricata]
MTLVLFIVLTWLLCFPGNFMIHSGSRTNHTPASKSQSWLQEYADFVNKSILRDDMYKPNRSDNILCGKFPEKFYENFNVVKNYTFRIPVEYLSKLQLDRPDIEKLNVKPATSSVPVLVTASSANHFNEAQSLIKNIHEKVMSQYPGIKFIFYDIGLKESQVKLLKRHCRCEVRTLSFTSYPEHVRKLLGYTWKPIIIQTVLTEFDFVMWMDASVRFHGTSLDSLFSEASKTGIKLVPGGGSIAVRTHLNTFRALGERPCMFHWPELEATWMLVRRTKVIMHGVMKPWVSCALQFGCMAQPNPKTMLVCPWGNKKKFGSCHRFDQSVIGLILTRLFNYNVQLAHFKVSEYGIIRREDRSNYLEKIEMHQD